MDTNKSSTTFFNTITNLLDEMAPFRKITKKEITVEKQVSNDDSSPEKKKKLDRKNSHTKRIKTIKSSSGKFKISDI